MPVPTPIASLSMSFEVPVKAGPLKEFFASVPDEANVSVSTYSGDQRERTNGGLHITAKWPVPTYHPTNPTYRDR